MPRLELNSPLPVSPKILFRAVFVDGDKNSHKKGIFNLFNKDVREVPDLVNGGSNLVVAPAKMNKRYLEVTLFNDTLVICKVDTQSPMDRRLFFPPMPLTDVTATVLPGLNNAVDVILSAQNALRLVELEAGQRDKFFETFDRLKDAMAAYKGISTRPSCS